MVFPAGQSPGSMTQDTIWHQELNFLLIDTPGLADPQTNQYKLWNNLVDKIHVNEEINLDRDGIGCIIVPIMVPVSCRVELASIDCLYQVLLLLTVIYPNFF